MKTLEEVKKIMNTDKVFETSTSFGVNDFGKYRPNMTFIIQKDFKVNPLDYREDTPVKSMIANMNVDFNGSSSVLFGDFWKSKKGGACFRPKPIKYAQHVLVRVNWGGAFCSTRGSCSSGIGETYFRRAASNGRGTGYDYWVLPIGFKRLIFDEEIDGEISSSSVEMDYTEQAKLVRDQLVKYDLEQTEKAEVKAKAKTDAEIASRAAKNHLSARLEAVNERLQVLKQKLIEFEDTSFKWGWQSYFYTEEKVADIERQVENMDKQFAEKARKRLVREEFESKFKVFYSRIKALGLTVEFTDERVLLAGDYYGQPYSEEGIVKFVAEIEKREKEAAEAKVKAEAETCYCELRQKAEEAGLPKDIRIWHRRGGRTNAGDGWVIGSDGQNREPTGMYNENPRRLSRYGEGDMIWEQILPGELVLKWSKSCSAASHEFKVIYFPEEGLTEEQLERIAEIEDELEKEWENACGLASGIPSPPIGEGWGLVLRKNQEAEKPLKKELLKDYSLADLCEKFNKKRR